MRDKSPQVYSYCPAPELRFFFFLSTLSYYQCDLDSRRKVVK